MENANRDELRKQMADMCAFLREQPTEVAEYDEKLLRRLIEKVTVYEDRFTLELKSGIVATEESQKEMLLDRAVPYLNC
jgi:site-specific DNA recombinase